LAITLVTGALITSNVQVALADNGAFESGRNIVLSGFSFFHPIAAQFNSYANQYVPGHSGYVVTAAGDNGTPLMLWENAIKRQAIQNYLDNGNIDLLGMPYFNQELSGVEHWVQWIDYALSQNSNTSFFIGLPWMDYPSSRTLEESDDLLNSYLAGEYRDTVDQLRALYPDTKILAVVYAGGAAELRRLQTVERDLPGVDSVIGRDKTTSIHKDSKGHAGDVLRYLAGLEWLNIIYGTDLTTVNHEHPADLATIAQIDLDFSAEFNAIYNGEDSTEPDLTFPDSYSLDQDTSLSIAAPGVLSNDRFSGEITTALVNNVSNGELILNADGSFDYTPTADTSGIDSFTYMVNNGEQSSLQETVTLTINAIASGTWTEMSYDDFESGWGNYVSGGPSDYLYNNSGNNTKAHEGSGAALLSDHRLTQSLFSLANGMDIDTNNYSQLKVEFWFMAESIDTTNKDFWVEYFDGTTWHEVARYAQGNDFFNSQYYNPEIIINETDYIFPSDMRIRFVYDDSGSRDHVFIDEIRVSALQ